MSSNNLFSRSSSSSFRQSSASKIDQLYEISYVPNDSRIPVKHLVSLSLLSDLPRHCLAQGYTHIHFGAIRLTLTFHDRKGLPSYSRIAFLDTRLPFITKLAYRVQNHSLDILVLGQDNAGDALMIDVDSNATPTCTYIHHAPVRSTSAPEFVRHENGLVEIKFSSSQPNSENVFPTGIHMITPTDQEPDQEVKHIWRDVCNCESCLDEAAKIDDDEDLPKKRKSSKQKTQKKV
ncbi:hypothetical protein Tco_1291562 [Tanacetum coccineum]